MAESQVRVYTEDGNVIGVDVWSGGAWRSASFTTVDRWDDWDPTDPSYFLDYDAQNDTARVEREGLL